MQMGDIILVNKFEKEKKCGERGSNTRPSDLQSDALPTELSPLDELYNPSTCILY